MLTIDQLTDVLRECGADEPLDLDAEFPDLGLDSLAVMEIRARLQQRSGRTIPEDPALELATPRKLMDFLNQRIGV